MARIGEAGSRQMEQVGRLRDRRNQIAVKTNRDPPCIIPWGILNCEDTFRQSRTPERSHACADPLPRRLAI